MRSVSSFSFGRGTGVRLPPWPTLTPATPALRSRMTSIMAAAWPLPACTSEWVCRPVPRPVPATAAGPCCGRPASGGGLPASEGGHLPGGARSESAGLLGWTHLLSFRLLPTIRAPGKSAFLREFGESAPSPPRGLRGRAPLPRGLVVSELCARRSKLEPLLL